MDEMLSSSVPASNLSEETREIVYKLCVYLEMRTRADAYLAANPRLQSFLRAMKTEDWFNVSHLLQVAEKPIDVVIREAHHEGQDRLEPKSNSPGEYSP